MIESPPEEKKKGLQHEIEDLRKELEHFQKEKDRVRTIIGQIGGMPKFRTKIMNILFIVVLATSVSLSIVVTDKWRWVMVEIATVTLSLKILYLIHCEMKMNHFQFWMLSSIEWRLTEMKRQLLAIASKFE
ncbi:MAG: hypothetical protein WDA68_01865 [Phycisphaerae bacterium]